MSARFQLRVSGSAFFVVFTIIIAMVLILSACHKYPEDPFISFRKPTKRLLRGSWKITAYKIEGVDHSHDFDVFLAPATLTECKIKFSELDYHIEDSQGNWLYHHGDESYLYSRTLKIVAFDTLFNEKFWKIPPTSPPAYANHVEWWVKELYGKKMHLQLGNSDIYFTRE